MAKIPTIKNINALFSNIKKLKVFVVGDAMIDQYWSGQIDRISPEAPVPVFSITNKQIRPGGAANVAINCRTMGAQVHLFTVLGKDDAAKKLIAILEQEGIQSEGCMVSKSRATTLKTRIIAKNQQVIRLDEEDNSELSISDEHQFIDMCLRAIQIEKPDLLIFEDYNKGVLKKNVIEKLITHCQHVGVITAVDPKKENFLSYRGVDLFKPNLKEVNEALKLSITLPTMKLMKSVHQLLTSHLQHKITLITLSEFGIFAENSTQSVLYPAHLRNIADVSGAGDTVIAVAALVYAVTKDIQLTTYISNLAGGMVCEMPGVAPMYAKKLMAELRQLNETS